MKQMWDSKWKDNRWEGFMEALRKIRYYESKNTLYIQYINKVSGEADIVGYEWQQ